MISYYSAISGTEHGADANRNVPKQHCILKHYKQTVPAMRLQKVQSAGKLPKTGVRSRRNHKMSCIAVRNFSFRGDGSGLNMSMPGYAKNIIAKQASPATGIQRRSNN